jgi:hypothetical protein
MIDVWRAAALHIDFLAPDIYLENFRDICREYTQSGNPLMIPEAQSDERAASYVFYAVAEHDAICFSPFGIDSIVEPHPLTASYKLLSEMIPVITKYHGTGRMIGFADDPSYSPGFNVSMGGPIRGFEHKLGSCRLRVRFNKPLEKGEVPAAGLVIATSDDEYIVAGTGFTLSFAPKPGKESNVEILTLDEGRFERGKWIPSRRLNGDESQAGRIVYMSDELGVRIVKVYNYT